MKLNAIMIEAFYHAGYFFAKSKDGVTHELVDLLTQSGIENVQSSVYTLVHTPDNEAGEYFYQGMAHALRTLLPFFQKWTRVPEDYQRTYKRALKEMREPGFMSSGTILTAWGTKRG